MMSAATGGSPAGGAPPTKFTSRMMGVGLLACAGVNRFRLIVGASAPVPIRPTMRFCDCGSFTRRRIGLRHLPRDLRCRCGNRAEDHGLVETNDLRSSLAHPRRRALDRLAVRRHQRIGQRVASDLASRRSSTRVRSSVPAGWDCRSDRCQGWCCDPGRVSEPRRLTARGRLLCVQHDGGQAQVTEATRFELHRVPLQRDEAR